MFLSCHNCHCQNFVNIKKVKHDQCQSHTCDTSKITLISSHIMTIKDLANLISKKNILDIEISKIIGRPAEKGHVGEYIASQIFDIELSDSATNKGSDGYFRTGNLSNKQVNVKFYGKREGILDVNTTTSPPEYYLVLTGPSSPATSSKGTSRPWIIESVFLFEHEKLIEILHKKGIQIGVATSVSKDNWERAELYPHNTNNSIILTEEQKVSLSLFNKNQ